MDIEALQASVLRYFSGNIDQLPKVGLYHKSAKMLNKTTMIPDFQIPDYCIPDSMSFS
jgi:hypothetical protein